MTIWEPEFPFLIIKWCPIIIFSEVPWWLKLSYLTQRHKEVSGAPKAELEAHDLHSRMYHTMKTQTPLPTGTQGRLSPWPSASPPALVRMDFRETAARWELESEHHDPKIQSIWETVASNFPSLSLMCDPVLFRDRHMALHETFYIQHH